MTAKVYKAKDFMSKYVLSVPADCTVQELIHLFVSHPIDAIPVTDGDNKLLGIVSEGDLLYKKVRPYVPQYVDVLGASLYYCGYGRYEKPFRKLLATRADEIMTKDVRCVTPETDMDTITSLMIDEHLKTVPVVDKNNRLAGIVTRHDILGVIAATDARDLIDGVGESVKNAMDSKENKEK